ncbi:MAG: TIGR03619 family F420-dependent LLM class oxidoreductase [Actinobacteria bacterium]|nr:TIGR03619 family F420-dependent LLM class oxidoreductase [Actinomycetota bacterium]
MKFWSATAFMDARQLITVSRLLDEAGYHGIMVSDHLVYPKVLESKYPYSPYPDGRPMWDEKAQWPDPMVLIGAMAAVTQRLHFNTNIYVAPHRPLVQLAKEVSTAAVISENRVALGVGAGWMKEEFDLHGVNYATRGKRLNEMIPALRSLWNSGWVEWHGEYFDVPLCTMEPTPTKPIPIYGGGHTDAALKRAARFCDGWIGNAYPWDQAEHYVGKLKGYLKEFGREHDDFDVMCGIYAMPSVDLYKRAEEKLGVTSMICMPWAMDQNVSKGQMEGLNLSADDYRPSIEKFAEDIVSQVQH